MADTWNPTSALYPYVKPSPSFSSASQQVNYSFKQKALIVRVDFFSEGHSFVEEGSILYSNNSNFLVEARETSTRTRGLVEQEQINSIQFQL